MQLTTQLPQLESTTVYMHLPQAVNQPFIMPTASLKLLLAERKNLLKMGRRAFDGRKGPLGKTYAVITHISKQFMQTHSPLLYPLQNLLTWFH